MNGLPLLLSLIVATPGAGPARTPFLIQLPARNAALARATVERDVRTNAQGWVRTAPPPRTEAMALACPGIACPGVAGIPEHGALRPRTDELILAWLSRAPIPPVAAMAGFMADSKLRILYRPHPLARARIPGDGWGEVIVALRWRLDATNMPVEAPHRRALPVRP